MSLAGLAWPVTLAVACSEDAPGDAQRLSSLSTGQLQALCAELDEGWPAQVELQTCDNGWTLYLDQSGLDACGTRTTSCSASAGEWRACMQALFAGACQVPEAEPEACIALRSAEGCSGLALPFAFQCTPPQQEQVAAYDGVYEIISHSRSDSGCDAEGPALQPEGYWALEPITFPGQFFSPLRNTPMVALQSCDGIEECQALMADILSRSEPYLWLPRGGSEPNAPDGFRCAPDDSGALLDTVVVEALGTECARTTVELSLRLEPDGVARLEQRTFELRTPALGEPCFANVGAGERGSCVSLSVMRAQRRAPL